jgi:hypothetical protein
MESDMERVGLPKVAVIAVWAGAPPAPSSFRGDPGLDSLPTCPSWYEHYERVLMTGISGRSPSPALSAQAAVVVRRGTAPTFMKEFSSQQGRR